MRTFRGSLLIAVVLVTSTSVFALTSPPWAGTFSADVTIWANSRIYTGYLQPNGTTIPSSPALWISQGATPAIQTTRANQWFYGGTTLRQTIATANGFVAASAMTYYTNPDTVLDYIPPTGNNVGQKANESDWGVFYWNDVRSAAPTGINNMNQDGVIWSPTQDPKDIVGIFYGQVDDKVLFYNVGSGVTATDPATWNQEITSSASQYKMWYQNQDIFKMGKGTDLNSDGDVADPGEEGWQLRLGEDQYATIGYDALGNPLPVNVSEPVLWGSSYDSPNDNQDAEILVYWYPNSGHGTQDTYIKLNGDPGYSWQPDPTNQDMFFQRIFPFNLFVNPDRLGNEAQLYLHASSMAATQYGWALTSTHSSAVYGSTVPEPMTMMSLALGGMGLVGYLRKRRNK